tara:strand:+ start:1373 stop:1804 length:432 start_codon:yes stop_codon:yes gene_type:complete
MRALAFAVPQRGGVVQELIARNGVGLNCTAQLLLTAGNNPECLRSEANFAALCGVSPGPASSGKMTQYRLNRDSDRSANSALQIIAIGRLRLDPKTKAYVAPRTTQGHSELETIRCLKRYIAREGFKTIEKRHKQVNQAQIMA